MIHSIYPGHLLVINWLVKKSETYIYNHFHTRDMETHGVCTVEVLGLCYC